MQPTSETVMRFTQPPLLLRSMLFVPGDSERKLVKCESVAADALILDLEDSVDPSRKATARGLVADFLRSLQSAERSSGRSLWVRINPLAGVDADEDLERVLPARPDGIVLPKPKSAEDVRDLGRRLDRLEVRLGFPVGSTKILPTATETPAALFALDGYAHCGARLAAMTWGAEDLSVALGAATAVDERGEWLPPYQLARSLCLLAAAAAGVPAIDTVHIDLRGVAGLARQAAAAKRDGFLGKLAIHPDQVEVFNSVFVPAMDELAYARRTVDAFERSAGAGVMALDGRMLDRPHLDRARRVLALAAALETNAAGGGRRA